jgi:hypothetical protein
MKTARLRWHVVIQQAAALLAGWYVAMHSPESGAVDQFVPRRHAASALPDASERGASSPVASAAPDARRETHSPATRKRSELDGLFRVRIAGLDASDPAASR